MDPSCCLTTQNVSLLYSLSCSPRHTLSSNLHHSSPPHSQPMTLLPVPKRMETLRRQLPQAPTTIPTNPLVAVPTLLFQARPRLPPGTSSPLPPPFLRDEAPATLLPLHHRFFLPNGLGGGCPINMQTCSLSHPTKISPGNHTLFQLVSR